MQNEERGHLFPMLIPILKHFLFINYRLLTKIYTFFIRKRKEISKFLHLQIYVQKSGSQINRLLWISYLFIYHIPHRSHCTLCDWERKSISQQRYRVIKKHQLYCIHDVSLISTVYFLMPSCQSQNS